MTIRNNKQPLLRAEKESSQVLKDSKPLNTLLNALRDAVIFFDRWGTATYWNRTAVECFGYAELAGKTFIELVPDWDDPAERQREIMQVIRTQVAMLDSRERWFHPTADRWFRVDKVPQVDDCGNLGMILVVCDVTQSVRREITLVESEARYRAYIASSMDAIWRYDICPPIDIALPSETQIDLIMRRSCLVECNDRLADLYGVSNTNALLGSPLNHNGSPTIREDVSVFVHGGYRLEEREYERHTHSGQVVSLQSSAIGIVEQGYLTRVWGTTRDVTEKQRYLERLEYLANHDVLTALPNRSVLYRTMARVLKEAPPSQNMALLLIDLDRFKEINDTLGHLAGDKMLKQLGPRLQSVIEDTSGLVVRLGGDEFAIFLDNLRNPQQAVVIAHRMLDNISIVFDVEGLRTEISASVGVALCPDQASDVSTLMRFADVAMYRAKQSLQGVAVYDPAFDPHSPKRLELMGALGRAIREDELTLFFQPKIHLQTHRIYGFEALLRWNHPQLGFIPPSDFIPIAEHSNLIYPMTLWVLENGIRYCRHWLDQGYEITVAMNLSARNLLDDRIVLDLKKLLQKYNVPPQCCELEITESTIMADPPRAEAALGRIHRLGVQLSVDDFGTGYSSLAYLKRLPVQALKIDRTFVHSMMQDAQDDIIVRSIVQLAHNLGLEVIAEGVESAAVYQRLAEIGCDHAQGFYMGKPFSAVEAEAWLLESTWGLQNVV